MQFNHLASRKKHPPRCSKAGVGKLFLVIVAGATFATLTPSVAHAASAYISISRVDNKLVVEGRGFPANKAGIVKAGIGTGGSYTQQNVTTNGQGYFWRQYTNLDISRSGYTWARAWINKSAHATATKTFTPIASTPAPSAPSSSSSYKKLVLSEDFNGSSLNTSRYTPYEGVGNGGVGYRSRSAVSMSNGSIKITGNSNVAGGFAFQQAYTYGRYEIRAKLTTSGGIWSKAGYNTAMLLWPTSERWPVDGEIDISEIFSGGYAKSCSFLHWGSTNRQKGLCKATDTSAWHTYAVDWSANRMSYYIDGVKILESTDPASIPDNPHFLAVQLDVAKNVAHVNGTSLYVDWVKIYR